MISLVLAALALSTADASSRDASVNRWILRADEARCTLSRREADTGKAFFIDTVPGTDAYRFAISTPAVQGSASFRRATMVFEPSGDRVSGFATVAPLPDATGQILMMAGLTDTTRALFGRSEALTIRADHGAAVSVMVPDSAKASDALAGCVANRLVAWGADPAQFEAGGAPPLDIVPRDDWISNGQLIAMIRQSSRNRLDFTMRATISAEGVVDGCEPLDPAADTKAAAIACHAILARRLMTPAHDSAGRAVRGIAVVPVTVASVRSMR